MTDKRRDGDTFLCLTCGHMYEGQPEESGESPARKSDCPVCRSPHVLNLSVGYGQPGGCGSGSGGFTFGYG
jgi:hypothetical protein